MSQDHAEKKAVRVCFVISKEVGHRAYKVEGHRVKRSDRARNDLKSKC